MSFSKSNYIATLLQTVVLKQSSWIIWESVYSSTDADSINNIPDFRLMCSKLLADAHNYTYLYCTTFPSECAVSPNTDWSSALACAQRSPQAGNVACCQAVIHNQVKLAVEIKCDDVPDLPPPCRVRYHLIATDIPHLPNVSIP